MTDDLNNLSFRLSMFLSIRCQFYHNLMTVHGTHLFSGRNINILQISLIIRTYKSKTFTLLIQSDNLLHLMRHDSYDFSFFPLTARRTCNNTFHFISLECTVHILSRNKDILIFTLYHNKSKSTDICLEGSCDTLCLTFTIFSSFRKSNLPFLNKSVQYFLKLSSLFFRYLKNRRNLFDFHWDIKIITNKVINHFFSLFKCLIHSISFHRYCSHDVTFHLYLK